VDALRGIGQKLGKKDWDFGIDPCSGEGNWKVVDGRNGFESTVTCDCTFKHNSSCHVVSMYFSLSQSLVMFLFNVLAPLLLWIILIRDGFLGQLHFYHFF
jgi:hypothetical protein